MQPQCVRLRSRPPSAWSTSKLTSRSIALTKKHKASTQELQDTRVTSFQTLALLGVSPTSQWTLVFRRLTRPDRPVGALGSADLAELESSEFLQLWKDRAHVFSKLLCKGLNCVSWSLYVGVLNPRTSGCEYVWRWGL